MEEAEGEGAGEVRLEEMLELQLAEVEMLQSMFPQPGEFTLDSQTILDQLQAFVDGRIAYDEMETRVGFTVRIIPSDTKANPLELVCNFPHEYPSVLPEIFTRAPAMGHDSHRRLKEDLHACIASLDTHQIIIGSVVEWLQENAQTYMEDSGVGGPNSAAGAGTGREEDCSFTRLWLYSHHIYSKFKRRDLVDWGQELKLHGFSMPGKPGVGA